MAFATPDLPFGQVRPAGKGFAHSADVTQVASSDAPSKTARRSAELSASAASNHRYPPPACRTESNQAKQVGTGEQNAGAFSLDNWSKP
jgi:hypothetical protein